MTGAPLVGVLAVQGDFEAHGRAIARLGAAFRPLRLPRDVADIDALVIPGGESTTIAKGMARDGLYEPIAERIAGGMPVLGTCAGAILLARAVENHPVRTLGVLDVVAARNAYGTQVDSFTAPADADAAAGLEGLECVFIRAPRIADPGPGVEILAQVDGEPVLVREGRVIAATFHPELTGDARVHRLLIEALESGSGEPVLAAANA